jgi:hypothetical protein
VPHSGQWVGNEKIVLLDANDVRNHLARLFDHHHVANADVFAGDFVGIVQACPLDRGTGQLDRLQIGHRCDRSRLADLHADGEQPGGGFVFFEFVGDQPAWAFRRAAQPLALIEAIDLQHQSVDFEVELVQPVDQCFAMGDGGLEAVETFDVGRRRQAIAGQLGQKVHVVVGLEPLDLADAVAEQPQPPLGANARIEQADGTGRQIAAVGKRRQSGVALLLVERDQVGIADVDFATDFEQCRRRFAGEFEGQVADRAHVVRNIVADAAVAPRGPLDEQPLFVG